MKFNKLVRDKIPKILKKRGKTSVTHVADEEDAKEILSYAPKFIREMERLIK